jgi:hypothetical protein
MQPVRSIAMSARISLAVLLTASLSLPEIAVAGSEGLVIAQGGFEKLPPSVAPTPYSPNAPSTGERNIAHPNSGSSERNQNNADRNSDRGTNPAEEPVQPAGLSWGSLAFTADGSYSSTWKMASQPEAEAKVLRQCARFGRGGCEVVSFSGQQCAALATFIGAYRRKRWNLSFTAGGMTYPEAQSAAMERCNSDERTQGHCQPRAAACADGR